MDSKLILKGFKLLNIVFLSYKCTLILSNYVFHFFIWKYEVLFKYNLYLKFD